MKNLRKNRIENKVIKPSNLLTIIWKLFWIGKSLWKKLFLPFFLHTIWHFFANSSYFLLRICYAFHFPPKYGKLKICYNISTLVQLTFLLDMHTNLLNGLDLAVTISARNKHHHTLHPHTYTHMLPDIITSFHMRIQNFDNFIYLSAWWWRLL